MVLGRTRAVATKFLSDIKKLLFYTTIVVQCVFFTFYLYAIYNNIDKTIFLIAYSLLFLLAMIIFINHLITHKKSSKRINKFNRFLRVFKYFVNGSMLVINVCEMMNYTTTGTNKLLLILSAITLFVQIIIELIRVIAETYIELFITAVQMDFSFVSKLTKVKDVKGGFYELIDAPLAAIANKIENKQPELSENEIRVNKLAEEYSEEYKLKEKEERKTKTTQKKKQIIEHLNIIKNKIFKQNKADKK